MHVRCTPSFALGSDGTCIGTAAEQKPIESLLKKKKKGELATAEEKQSLAGGDGDDEELPASTSRLGRTENTVSLLEGMDMEDPPVALPSITPAKPFVVLQHALNDNMD